MAERAGATAPDAALPEEPARWHRAIRAWRHESEEIERVGDRIADPETRATIRRLGQSYLDRSEAAFADAAQSSDFVSDLAWLALDFERVGRAGRLRLSYRATASWRFRRTRCRCSTSMWATTRSCGPDCR